MISPRRLIGLPIIMALLLVLPGAGASAAEFTPAQRAEIVAVVRDALKQDPSILRDAVVALQADEGQRSQQATRAAISASARRRWWCQPIRSREIPMAT